MATKFGLAKFRFKQRYYWRFVLTYATKVKLFL